MALVPTLRPHLAAIASITMMPATPTPAIEAAPSFPTHIMSTVIPTAQKLSLIIIGQARPQRFRRMLPFVQSLSGEAPLTAKPLHLPT